MRGWGHPVTVAWIHGLWAIDQDAAEGEVFMHHVHGREGSRVDQGG